MLAGVYDILRQDQGLLSAPTDTRNAGGLRMATIDATATNREDPSGSNNMSQRMPTDLQAQAAQQAAAQATMELGCVLAAKQGDRNAFGKLAQQYQRQCAAVALRLLGNAHDASELVQDAL